MALTPEDVVNKRFQPTKFREGYDQDEVDDFLDEVVVELRRLNQENEELRQRLVAGESRITELQRGGSADGSAPQQQNSVPEAPQQEQPTEQSQPQYTAPAVVPAPVSYPSADQNAIDSGSTNNLLQLARKLHEEHVREGIEKRDALIAEGHATAARVISEAEAAQRAQISTLDREKQVLEQQKTSLEGRIDDLRTFEREYRQKLKGYIEGQLKDLDASDSPIPSVPASSAPSASPSTNTGEAATGDAAHNATASDDSDHGDAASNDSADAASNDSLSDSTINTNEHPAPVSAGAQNSSGQGSSYQPASYEVNALDGNAADGTATDSKTPPASFQGFGGN